MGVRVRGIPSPRVPGEIALDTATIQVAPDGSFAFIISRANGSFGAVAVDYNVTPYTGVPTPITGTVEFADGEVGSKTISSSVVDTEGSGVGSVDLLNPRSLSGGPVPTLGASSVALVIPPPAAIPQWDATIPVQNLQVGVQFTRDLNDYLNPDADMVSVVGTPPAGLGLSIVSNTVASALPVTEGTYDVEFDTEQVLDGDAEFLALAARDDVITAERFNYDTRAELLAAAAKTSYAHVGAGFSDPSVDPAPTAEKISLDPTVKRSGKGSLLLRYRADLEAFTAQSPNYSMSFGGPGVKVEGPPEDVFFVRVVARWNAAWLARTHSGSSNKLVIVFGAFTGAGAGQLGICTDQLNTRFPMMWRYGASFKFIENVWSTNPPGSGDHTYQTAMDLGPQGDPLGANDTNDLGWFQRRRGPVRREAARWEDIPDKENYPGRLKPDVDFVLTMGVNKISQEMKLWMAEYGQQPYLLSLRQAASLSADYTGIQILMRPDDNTNDPLTGNDLCTWIDSVVVTREPPTYPGGFTLPYAGAGEAPPGYPFSGSAQGSL